MNPIGRRCMRTFTIVLLTLTLTLSGCVTTLGLRTDTLGTPPGQPTVGPGTSVQGGGLQASVRSNGFAALVVAVGLGALLNDTLTGDEARRAARPRLEGDSRHLMRNDRNHDAPRVDERDCTAPIEHLRGNLRCR